MGQAANTDVETMHMIGSADCVARVIGLIEAAHRATM